MNDEAEIIDNTVRRHVGIAALRKLRRMVEAQREAEANNLRWVRRLGWVVGSAAVLGLFCVAAAVLR